MKKIIMVSMLSFASNSFAFGDLGHGAVGFIAETHLSSKAQRLVKKIMGADPMGLSGYWPDHVRAEPHFSAFDQYHYFDFPEGYKYENIPSRWVAPKSADTILMKVPALLTGKELKNTQKQVLFRYFVHIVGDVHQPLHVGNTLDMGGNLCTVFATNPYSGKNRKTNLHSFMDTELIEYLKKEVEDQARESGKPIKYFSYRHLGEALLAEATAKGQMEELKALAKKGKRSDWYEESRSLHSQVYPDGKTVPAAERTYCKTVNAETGKVENGKFDETRLPVLNESYMKEMLPIIKKQIILAGLRLQAELENMAKDMKPWTQKDEEKFYKAILPEK